MARYLGSVQGQGVVRLLFQTEDWLSWVVEDKKRCKMIWMRVCVVCESGAGEDVEHLLVTVWGI